MSKVNDTSGAQVGAVSAMVSASLRPMNKPASNGTQAEARRPIITVANTTPTQA